MTTLEAVLRDRRVNLRELSAKIGRSRPTLWRWSRGMTKPRQRDLEAIAQHLGVDVSVLTAPVSYEVTQ